MTTRGLELASETLTHVLGRLWETEKELKKNKEDYEFAQRAHEAVLEDTHKAIMGYKAAEKGWWEERRNKE